MAPDHPLKVAAPSRLDPLQKDRSPPARAQTKRPAGSPSLWGRRGCRSPPCPPDGNVARPRGSSPCSCSGAGCETSQRRSRGYASQVPLEGSWWGWQNLAKVPMPPSPQPGLLQGAVLGTSSSPPNPARGTWSLCREGAPGPPRWGGWQVAGPRPPHTYRDTTCCDSCPSGHRHPSLVPQQGQLSSPGQGGCSHSPKKGPQKTGHIALQTSGPPHLTTPPGYQGLPSGGDARAPERHICCTSALSSLRGHCFGQGYGEQSQRPHSPASPRGTEHLTPSLPCPERHTQPKPQSMPPSPRSGHVLVSGRLPAPRVILELGESSAKPSAGARYLSACRSWRDAAARPRPAGSGVRGAAGGGVGLALMPLGCTGPRGGLPRAAVPSHASPAHGLTSRPCRGPRP